MVAFTAQRKETLLLSSVPYVRDGSQVGYSFSLNQNNTQEGIKKSFIIGFNFAEGRMLKEYALTVLNNYFTDCIEESQSYVKKTEEKTEEKIETPTTTEDNNQDVNLDVPW